VDQKNVPKLFTHIETNPFLYLSSGIQPREELEVQTHKFKSRNLD